MTTDKNNAAPDPQPAELAEQQGVNGWDIAEKVRADLDRQSCPDAYMRIAVESVVKHLAATGKQQVGEVQGDMFWLAVDGERMGYSVEELIDDMCDGEEVEIQTAVQLPNFWVRVKAGDGGSVDFDVIDQRDAAPGVGQ
ncbi:hypothetical protein [Stenotrophomonas sp. TWI1151]|uniref:hypothetical protein n=1 Tax=Stenotrophomonas sp. TWI1151 TaxID=3136798 RepID=UPI003208B51C